MNEKNYPSRIARSRAELAARPPRVLPRVLGTLPILALALLMLVSGSMAWFIDQDAPPAATFGSGTFPDFMTLSKTELNFSGTEGQPFADSFVVTRKSFPSNVGRGPYAVKVTWQGTGASPCAAPATLTIGGAGQVSMSPGDTATVAVAGTYPAAPCTGAVVVTIGTADYDWGSVAVNVNASQVERTIDVDVASNGIFYGAGKAGPQFENLFVGTIKPAAGVVPYGLRLELSQYPTAGTVFPKGVIAQVQIKEPTPDATKIRADFTPSTAGTAFYIYQDTTVQNQPVCVTATLTSTDPTITGVKTFNFVLAHNGDKNLDLTKVFPNGCGTVVPKPAGKTLTPTTMQPAPGSGFLPAKAPKETGPATPGRPGSEGPGRPTPPKHLPPGGGAN